MNQNTVNKLNIGDTVVITSTNNDSKNYGKLGIVSEIARMESGKAYRIYLKPLYCDFEFVHYSKNLLNKDGLHGWAPSYLSMPNKKTKKIEKIDQSLSFKFVGSEEDVKKMIEEVKQIVKNIAPEAKLQILKGEK